MKNLRIAIIGAGIIGLYLAWKLSQEGYKITVFEKKEKIGKKACSGLFSERILGFISESQKLIQNQINSVLIRFPKKKLRIEFTRKFLVMNHFDLDNLVANLAGKAGAKIILNHPVNSIPQGFDRIIGCDGPNSIIRKKLGLSEPVFRLAIQGFIQKEDYSDFVETWPVSEGFTLRPFSSKGAGFIWRIPRGGETEYGIIAKPSLARKLFDDFLKKNNLQLEKLESALIPQGFSIPKNNSITLCGDAAGLTKSWSGGGVIWGLLAANILLKNFPDFLRYQKELKKFFLPKIIISKLATKMTYFFGFKTPWLLPKEHKIEGDFLI